MAAFNHSGKKDKSGIWRLIYILGGLIFTIDVIFIVAAIIVELRIGPSVLENRILGVILNFWEGTVNIQDVRFRYNGNMELSGLTLRDHNGKQWLYVPDVDLNVSRWWSSEPVVKNIALTNADIKIHIPAENQKDFALPFKSRYSNAGGKSATVEKFAIKHGSLSSVYDSKQNTVYDTFDLSLDKEGAQFRILANGGKEPDANSLSISGSIQAETFDASLNIILDQALAEPECAFILKLFDISNLDASGHIASEMTVAGCLRDLTSLRPQGKADIKNWSIKKRIDPNHALPAIIQNLAGTIMVDEGSFSCDSYTATFCEGKANGAIAGNISRDEGIALNGTFVASDVNMTKFTAALQAKKQMTGRGVFELNFGIVGRNVESLNGRGFVFLDDADVRAIPLITNILTFTGLENFDPVKMSDTTCVFEIENGVATIERARVANRLAAIVAEPGSTVNLNTGIVDGHVMVAPLDQLQEILKKVPGVNLIVNLKDRLTRLRVKGHWSDPPSKLITKEPLTDIREAAFGFFKDVAETGGQITENMRNTSRSLLKK